MRDVTMSAIIGNEPRYCTMVIGIALSSERITLLKWAGEPNPAEPTVNPPRVLLSVFDQLRNRVGRAVRRHRDEIQQVEQRRNRFEVLHRIIGDLLQSRQRGKLR